MTINSTSWKKLPIAQRDQEFDADDAISRIRDWADGNTARFSSMFLWRSPQGDPENRDTYRLPVGDILNGRPTLVPHAVFTAAAILGGAYGGLETVVDEKERQQLKAVVTQIYARFQQLWKDPRTRPPWERGRTPQERERQREQMKASLDAREEQDMNELLDSLAASVNSAGWSDMPIAEEDRAWRSSEAKARIFAWADGNFREYRRAFLWFDAAAPEIKASYKLPIADVIDGRLHVVPRAVNAVAAVLEGARGGVDISDADANTVRRIVDRIRKRLDEGDDAETASVDSLHAAAAPVAPPAEWFKAQSVSGPTPMTVTADGRVYGHIFAFGQCHVGIGDRCAMAPRSNTGYKFFLTGDVLTADGSAVRVGKITLGTGHAAPRLGWIPAADHYDNTGTQAAIGTITEDGFGGFFAGATVPGLSEERIAELRRSPISGDWRRINGNLELVAALAVNSPGYPILTHTASGEIHSLCATGIITDAGMMHDYGQVTSQASDMENELLSRLDALDMQIAALLHRSRQRRFASLDTAGRWK